MRERRVESYLHKQVTAAGGTTRKFKGRVNNPDRIVIWPTPPGALLLQPRVHFIECKAPRKKARAGQTREHKRLRAFGCCVFVLDTLLKIDHYVRGCK